MTAPPLAVYDARGRTCVGVEGRPRGVAFAFVGRTGGVSGGDFASLNVGDAVGDDSALVAENRRRALSVIGVSGIAAERPVIPRQVHGSDVVCVNSSEPATVAAACERARAGTDAVVVSTAGVAALMAFADCVPVILVAPRSCAVVHAGWRGAMARIAGKAARALARAAGCDVGDVWAYVGPHVAAVSYEVSVGLAGEFRSEFGESVLLGERHLDLGAAVARSLADVGVRADNVVDCGIDTATSTGSWYSHRASGGHTGRHAAVAWVPGEAAARTGGLGGDRF